MPLRIEMDIKINRSVPDVFAAWASADALAAWFAPMAVSKPAVEMEFQVDGRYSVEMHMEGGMVFVTGGQFKEIVPDEKIVMTWRCDAFPDPETLVTVFFDPIAGGTKVRLMHENFVAEETCANHTVGWRACLAQLNTVLTN